MNKLAIYIMTLLASHAALAQGTILKGKVVNEQNRPVAGAIVKLSGSGAYFKMVTDEQGEYASSKMPAGEYSVNIMVDGKRIRVEDLVVGNAHKEQQYYSIRLNGRSADVMRAGDDAPIEHAAETKVYNDAPPVRREERTYEAPPVQKDRSIYDAPPAKKEITTEREARKESKKYYKEQRKARWYGEQAPQAK